jgi:hypothetical protein
MSKSYFRRRTRGSQKPHCRGGLSAVSAVGWLPMALREGPPDGMVVGPLEMGMAQTWVGWVIHLLVTRLPCIANEWSPGPRMTISRTGSAGALERYCFCCGFVVTIVIVISFSTVCFRKLEPNKSVLTFSTETLVVTLLSDLMEVIMAYCMYTLLQL